MNPPINPPINPEERPKRVAHVLWRSRGGIRRHVRTLASRPPPGWESAGVWGPPDLAAYFADVGFHPIKSWPIKSWPIFPAGLLRPPRDVDLVHAHGMTAALVALASQRPPVVVSLHVVAGQSGRTRSPLTAALARWIARRADAVVAVSAEAGEGFGDVRIIAPAFDALPSVYRLRDDVRAELGVARDEVVVVTVSRLEDTKRLDLFITAVEAAGVTGGGVTGWIVGDGPDRERLDALARGSRTTLLGYRDDVADLLGAADMFALPSVSESYGIAVAEAIGAGLPVVATSTGAIGELVGSGGVVVPPDDPDAFVAAVVELATDEGARMRRARAAQGVVRPDATSLIAGLGAVYDDVVGKRR